MIQFVQPAALVGLIVAVTPLVIYLLLRRRRRELPWGATYLLRKTLATKRRTSRWLQYLVLALRCLLLALVALLLAEPFRRQAPPAIPLPAVPPTPLHRVVLVDDSESMSVTSDNRSRLDRLKQIVEALVLNQRLDDQTTLLSLLAPGSGQISNLKSEISNLKSPTLKSQISNLKSETFRGTFTGRVSPAVLRAALDRLRPHPGTVRLPAALAAALTELAATPEAAAEVYVFSDFPRELAADFPRLGWYRPAAASRGIRLVPVSLTDPAEAPPANVALKGVTLGSDLVAAGLPTTLYVDAVNHADTETPALFRLVIAGEAPQEVTAVMQPNEARRVPLDVTFARPGVTTAQVTASPGPLRSAATVSLSVAVPERLLVWLLADPPDPMTPGALSEAEFLRRAVAAVRRGAGPFEFVEAEAYQLTQPIPDDVAAVFLAGPRVITPATREPLTRFVRRGGGLVVTVAANGDLEQYNTNLSGLLPATLAGPARPAVDPEYYQNVRAATETLPALFAEFGAERPGDLGAARFYNWMTLKECADAEGVVLRLAEGEPLLLTRRVGRGTVLLLTSSVGISWSSLPVCQSFLPFSLRLLSAASAGHGFPRNLPPGTSFVTSWPAAGSLRLVPPNGEPQELVAAPGASGCFVVVPPFTERGLYRLVGTPEHEESFTVTGPPLEGDLRALSTEQRQTWERTLGAPVHADWARAVGVIGAADAHSRLWPWLLLAVLGVYLIETWSVRYL